jgi:putative polymerase
MPVIDAASGRLPSRAAGQFQAGPQAVSVLREHLPYLILAGAMLFNPVLAVVNGNLTGLGPAVVIAAEIGLIGAALLVAAMRYRPEMNVAVGLIVVLFLFMVLRSIAVDPGTSVKYFRDLLIAPAFLMLGLATPPRLLNRYVLSIQAVVLAVAAIEAFQVDLYAQVFRVKDYFIQTRGMAEADFWNSESDLFVSATRPDARFLSIVDSIMDAHRVSSIFLEPVSLGGYCIVITAYLCARWEALGWASRIFLLLSTLFLMVACDGRLAFVSFGFIVGLALLWQMLPRRAALLYLPGVLALAFLFVAFTGHIGGGDDFPGRVAFTVDLLTTFGPAEFLGLSEEYMTKAVDSGVSYIVTTQSILGLALFWAFCALSSREATRAQVRYTHALCLYVAFNALVSYGFLSIKTAALLWMIKGILEREGQPDAENRTPASSHARDGALTATD